MENKLIYYKEDTFKGVGGIVKITPDTRSILSRHMRETGFSASQIVEEWAKFVDVRYEVREV